MSKINILTKSKMPFAAFVCAFFVSLVFVLPFIMLCISISLFVAAYLFICLLSSPPLPSFVIVFLCLSTLFNSFFNYVHFDAIYCNDIFPYHFVLDLVWCAWIFACFMWH